MFLTPLPANSLYLINTAFRLTSSLQKDLAKGHRLISGRRTTVCIILSFKICHGRQCAQKYNHLPLSEPPLKILQRALVKLECESFFIATAALGAILQAPFQPVLFYPDDRSKQKETESKPRGSLRLCTTHPCYNAPFFPWTGSLAKA